MFLFFFEVEGAVSFEGVKTISGFSRVGVFKVMPGVIDFCFEASIILLKKSVRAV